MNWPDLFLLASGFLVGFVGTSLALSRRRWSRRRPPARCQRRIRDRRSPGRSSDRRGPVLGLARRFDLSRTPCRRDGDFSGGE